MAWAAVHEELDHGASPWFNVRLSGLEVVRMAALRARGTELFAKQISKARAVQTIRSPSEKTAPSRILLTGWFSSWLVSNGRHRASSSVEIQELRRIHESVTESRQG